MYALLRCSFYWTHIEHWTTAKLCEHDDDCMVCALNIPYAASPIQYSMCPYTIMFIYYLFHFASFRFIFIWFSSIVVGVVVYWSNEMVDQRKRGAKKKKSENKWTATIAIKIGRLMMTKNEVNENENEKNKWLPRSTKLHS